MLLLGHDQTLFEDLVFSSESRDLILDLPARVAAVRVILQLFLVGQGLLLNLQRHVEGTRGHIVRSLL